MKVLALILDDTGQEQYDQYTRARNDQWMI